MEREKFVNILEKININLSSEQLDQFDTYYELLVKWNEFMNLTGITDYDEVLIKHFVDSLAVFNAVCELSAKDQDIREKLDFNNNLSVADIGTGAGFPGLPIKIAFPDTEVLLLDSLNKRIKFLDEVVGQLGLQKIDTVHARAEDGARNVLYREKYMLGVSRAVANLSTLCEYVLPFVAVGGYFAAYKSGDIDEEINSSKKAVELLGGEITHVYRFNLPDTDYRRSIVFIKNKKATPKKYPRKSGLPSKEPLG